VEFTVIDNTSRGRCTDYRVELWPNAHGSDERESETGAGSTCRDTDDRFVIRHRGSAV